MSLPDEIVLIALGSNLGDAGRNILEAFLSLEAFSDEPIVRSSVWQTAPMDCPPGSPDFFNAVAALVPLPGETPFTLLKKTQALEVEFGRQPKRILNEPRALDLDLIAFGRLKLATPTLVLPHPRAIHRRFVLAPLAQIDPAYRFPGVASTVAQLLASFPSPSLL
jgi:2-amino-4-hydroxy-6-hydroxymethyldihydropteridine diphosphokinase